MIVLTNKLTAWQKVEIARNAVPASSGIWQYSICGISPATAQTLYNEYYALADK